MRGKKERKHTDLRMSEKLNVNTVAVSHARTHLKEGDELQRTSQNSKRDQLGSWKCSRCKARLQNDGSVRVRGSDELLGGYIVLLSFLFAFILCGKEGWVLSSSWRFGIAEGGRKRLRTRERGGEVDEVVHHWTYGSARK